MRIGLSDIRRELPELEAATSGALQMVAHPEPEGATDRPFPAAWREVVLLIALMAATIAVYWPVHRHAFIVLDDLPYVVHNPHITTLNWETVKWSFTTYRGANWFPLTWLSHAVDYRLFSLRAGRHHDINLLLHVCNALLLFWVLAQATGWVGRSSMVAALFALHPLNVESVAWVAERKNLLSMFFFLLTLGAWYAYVRRPRLGRYLIVAVLFALGLMCKPQIITLPFVLLLWDYWPLGRMFSGKGPPPAARAGKSGGRSFSRLVLEKLPLLALSMASAVMTIKAQTAGGTMSGAVNSFTFAARAGNAIIAYVRYLGYAIWPSRLAFFYPHARTSPAWEVMAALVLLAAITVFAIRSRNRPYLAVGWFWFLGTLVPMIGLVQVGSQAMADRYAYLPMVGLFLAVSWGVADWAARWRSSKAWVPAGAIVVLLLLSMATRRQLGYWSDDLTLWRHTAAVTRNNWMAENMIGEDLLRDGDREGAIPHFRAAASMEPLFPFPHLHIGIYEEEHGHPGQALKELSQVLQLTEPFAAYTPTIRSNALVYMSYACNRLGDYRNQEKYMDMAARQRPQPP
ncbi:MAG TPA: hypothetical protein VL240_13365 [Candidatus Binatia bacterium]|nr:hypothetical protein [Candidatus Binatia bacterium]